MDAKREEALREYHLTQQIIDNFDNRTLLIKSWSVTVSGAGLAAGFLQYEPRIFLLSAASALLFWYVEASWKSFQRILMDRSERLEELLQADVLEYRGPAINAQFQGSFEFTSKVRRFPVVFFYGNTFLPHLVIMVAGIWLYFAEQ